MLKDFGIYTTMKEWWSNINIDLRQGDCLKLMKDIPDGSLDLIITDPPYEVATTGAGLYKQSGRVYHNEIRSMSDGFNTDTLDEMCRIMKKINIYIWCSQKQIMPLLDYFVTTKKCNWNILTWHKTNPVPACGNKYLTDTEFVLFFREKGVKVYGDFHTKRTWYATPVNKHEKQLYNHPTVKPVDILENFIINSSLENDIVFDPFMGTGSIGVAAVKQNRRFIGMEIVSEHFITAQTRINKAREEREVLIRTDKKNDE